MSVRSVFFLLSLLVASFSLPLLDPVSIYASSSRLSHTQSSIAQLQRQLNELERIAIRQQAALRKVVHELKEIQQQETSSNEFEDDAADNDDQNTVSLAQALKAGARKHMEMNTEEQDQQLAATAADEESSLILLGLGAAAVYNWRKNHANQRHLENMYASQSPVPPTY